MVTWAPGLSEGIELCSPAKRLAGHLLDGVLAIVTLGVGWLVWAIVVWGRGQSPGKQLLGMTVVIEGTRKPAGRGRMFFREIVAKTLVGYLPMFVLLAAPENDDSALLYVLVALVLGLATTFWLLWDRYRQQLWDKVAGTLVVDDPFRQLGRAAGGRRSAYERAIAPQTTRAASQPPLSAVSFDRAIDYFRLGRPDVGLMLLRQGAQDASRRGDRAALERVLRLTADARRLIPPNLSYKADEIVRIANDPTARRRTAR